MQDIGDGIVAEIDVAALGARADVAAFQLDQIVRLVVDDVENASLGADDQPAAAVLYRIGGDRVFHVDIDGVGHVKADLGALDIGQVFNDLLRCTIPRADKNILSRRNVAERDDLIFLVVDISVDVDGLGFKEHREAEDHAEHQHRREQAGGDQNVLEADLLEGHGLFVAADDFALLLADLAGAALLLLLLGVFVDEVAFLVVARLEIADLFVALAAELFLTREVFLLLGAALLAARVDRISDLALGNVRFFGFVGGLFILFFLFFLFLVEPLRLPRGLPALLGELFFILGIQQQSS